MGASANTLYREQAILNTLRGVAISGVTPYVGLLTALPVNEGDAATEASGTAYARQAVVFTAPQRYDNDGTNTHYSYVTSASPVTFPYVGAGTWGTILGVGVYDADSGGNLLCILPLAVPKVTELNDQLSIPAGALSISQD